MKRNVSLGVLENDGDTFEENTEYPTQNLSWMVVLDVPETIVGIEKTETYRYLLSAMTCDPISMGLLVSII